MKRSDSDDDDSDITDDSSGNPSPSTMNGLPCYHNVVSWETVETHETDDGCETKIVEMANVTIPLFGGCNNLNTTVALSKSCKEIVVIMEIDDRFFDVEMRKKNLPHDAHVPMFRTLQSSPRSVTWSIPLPRIYKAIEEGYPKWVKLEDDKTRETRNKESKTKDGVSGRPKMNNFCWVSITLRAIEKPIVKKHVLVDFTNAFA